MSPCHMRKLVVSRHFGQEMEPEMVMELELELAGSRESPEQTIAGDAVRDVESLMTLAFGVRRRRWWGAW